MVMQLFIGVLEGKYLSTNVGWAERQPICGLTNNIMDQKNQPYDLTLGCRGGRSQLEVFKYEKLICMFNLIFN